MSAGVLTLIEGLRSVGEVAEHMRVLSVPGIHLALALAQIAEERVEQAAPHEGEDRLEALAVVRDAMSTASRLSMR
jgi:flavin-dependent dehydrogenase